jgi:SAM-dependent methyltransferase
MSTNTEGYFEVSYRNYLRQNPSCKTSWYLEIVLRFQNPGGRLLDIGCAYGLFLEKAELFYQVYGTEIHEYALRAAGKRLVNARLRGDSLPSIGFVEEMNVITLFDVIEHVHDLPNSFLSIKRQLSLGGIIVIVVPVYDGPFGPLVHLLDKDETHIHKESRYFWLDKISSHFAIVFWCGVYRYLMFGRWYIHLPTRMFRSFSPAILVVGRKEKH